MGMDLEGMKTRILKMKDGNQTEEPHPQSEKKIVSLMANLEVWSLILAVSEARRIWTLKNPIPCYTC